MTYRALGASLETSTVESFAQQLGPPALPGLEVNSLQTTLEGS